MRINKLPGKGRNPGEGMKSEQGFLVAGTALYIVLAIGMCMIGDISSPVVAISAQTVAALLSLFVALRRGMKGASLSSSIKPLFPFMVGGVATFLVVPWLVPRGSLAVESAARDALMASLVASITLPLVGVAIDIFAVLLKRLVGKLCKAFIANG